MTEFRNVRLQSPQRQIAARESWRQANDAELWHGHAWLRGLRRCECCGLRASRNGAILLQRGYLSNDRFIPLAQQSGEPDHGNLSASQQAKGCRSSRRIGVCEWADRTLDAASRGTTSDGASTAGGA